MNFRRLPAVVLAAVIQLSPIVRVTQLAPATAPSGFAVIMQWAAGAVAMLGAYHAVSGASAAISGLAPINASGVATGPVTTTAVGTNGQIFRYRIVVTNPGSDHSQDYWNAGPLPPGLTINTNVGGNGWITGTPTQSGTTFPVTLLAGNLNYGSITKSNFTITIVGNGTASAPQITTQPQNTTVTNGGNANFSVTATGTAPLTYQWRKTGANVPGATTSTFAVSGATTNDAVGYSVVVGNSSGSVTSSVATLTVLLPPAVITGPQNLTVTNGGTAGFSVIASGTAPLTYQWRKGGANIAGVTASSYAILGVTTNDAAGYSVVVGNSVGSVTSAVATLTVLVPPAIRTPPQSLTVTNGSNASFSVLASGSAPLSYQWKFNGNNVGGATTSSLTVTGAQSSNQGDFTVVVSNAAGSVTSAAAHLTVQSGTTVPLQLSNPQPAGNGWSLVITGPDQTSVVIWASGDLNQWSALATNTISGGSTTFTDTSKPGLVRFYRVSQGK
jgi:hypothetical protein